jgi:hypothetical protein
MDAAMKEKIDRVLDTVKEPETGLSMAQLGLVERIRYNEDKKKLTIYSSNLKHNPHLCCTVLQGLLITGTLKALTEGFHQAFPDLAVEIV